MSKCVRFGHTAKTTTDNKAQPPGKRMPIGYIRNTHAKHAFCDWVLKIVRALACTLELTCHSCVRLIHNTLKRRIFSTDWKLNCAQCGAILCTSPHAIEIIFDRGVPPFCARQSTSARRRSQCDSAVMARCACVSYRRRSISISIRMGTRIMNASRTACRAKLMLTKVGDFLCTRILQLVINMDNMRNVHVSPNYSTPTQHRQQRVVDRPAGGLDMFANPHNAHRIRSTHRACCYLCDTMRAQLPNIISHAGRANKWL